MSEQDKVEAIGDFHGFLSYRKCLEDGSRSELLSPGKLSTVMKTNAYHSSMEDIRRPQNFRSGGSHLQELLNITDESKEAIVSAHFHGLSVDEAENRSLYKYIQRETRAGLLRKAAMIFLRGGLRRSMENSSRLLKAQIAKEEECAARKILHGLLLNCWRNAKCQLGKLKEDHEQLTVTVENLSLQLRVLRHLQVEEKNNANEKVGDVRSFKNQIASSQKSLKSVENELSGMQEELRFSHEDNQKLQEQTAFLQKELREIQQQKEAAAFELEMEKKRAIRAEEETQRVKAEYSYLRKQVKELSNHSFHWQERVRHLEAKGIAMTDDIELRETSLKDIKVNFQLLLAEMEQYKMKKNVLQLAYDSAAMKLDGELKRNGALAEELSSVTAIVAAQQHKLKSLEKSVLDLRSENRGLQEELYDFKLKNLRNRRAWVNMIYGVSPTRLLEYLFFGGSDESDDLEKPR